MKKMEIKALNKGMLITFQYSNPNLMSFISEIWKKCFCQIAGAQFNIDLLTITIVLNDFSDVELDALENFVKGVNNLYHNYSRLKAIQKDINGGK